MRNSHNALQANIWLPALQTISKVFSTGEFSNEPLRLATNQLAKWQALVPLPHSTDMQISGPQLRHSTKFNTRPPCGELLPENSWAASAEWQHYPGTCQCARLCVCVVLQLRLLQMLQKFLLLSGC